MNPGDTHTLEWDSALSGLDYVTIDGATVTVDPTSLGDTLMTASATVTDDGNPILSASDSVVVKILFLHQLWVLMIVTVMEYLMRMRDMVIRITTVFQIISIT